MPTDERPIVVYVDDELTNLKVFEANFRKLYHLHTFTSGAAALAFVTEAAQQVAVVLSDQRMPEMTGVELLEQVRKAAPEAQRFIVTAYSDATAMLDAVNRGQVNRFFVKPWTKADLQVALDDALRMRAMQARVREIEARMLKTAPLVTMGQMSAGIAHELMNPVAYVGQTAEALAREFKPLQEYAVAHLRKKPEPEVTSSLEEIPQILSDLAEGVRHIRQVALGVRAQARGDDVDELCDIKEVAEFAGKLARAEMREKARLVIDGPPMQVRAGPVHLGQILLNLIVNAVHAMAEGRKGLIEVRWKDQPEHALVEVKDNGSGIPPGLLEKVFEPLFTTKPAGIGTGLGLSICRDLVRGLGGELTLASVLGEGTTVSFTLRKPTPEAGSP